MKAEKNLMLPQKNDNNRRVYAFLKSNNIDSYVINFMLKNEYIYEDAEHHNAVFVGYDENKNATQALMVGSGRKPYTSVVRGSSEIDSFNYVPKGTSETLHLFTSPLDLLAYMSIQQLNENGSWLKGAYLSVREENGMELAPTSLNNFLSVHPEIKNVKIHFRNDEQSIINAGTLRTTLSEQDVEADVELSNGQDFVSDLKMLVDGMEKTPTTPSVQTDKTEKNEKVEAKIETEKAPEITSSQLGTKFGNPDYDPILDLGEAQNMVESIEKKPDEKKMPGYWEFIAGNPDFQNPQIQKLVDRDVLSVNGNDLQELNPAAKILKESCQSKSKPFVIVDASSASKQKMIIFTESATVAYTGDEDFILRKDYKLDEKSFTIGSDDYAWEYISEHFENPVIQEKREKNVVEITSSQVETKLDEPENQPERLPEITEEIPIETDSKDVEDLPETTSSQVETKLENTGKIHVLVCRENMLAEEKDIDNTYEALCEICGKTLDFIVPENGVTIVCSGINSSDHIGSIDDYPDSFRTYDDDKQAVIRRDFVVLYNPDPYGDFESLPSELMGKYKARMLYPERAKMFGDRIVIEKFNPALKENAKTKLRDMFR